MKRAVRLLAPVFGALLLFPAGAHTLSLVDGDGPVVDTVSFSVRGNPIAVR